MIGNPERAAALLGPANSAAWLASAAGAALTPLLAAAGSAYRDRVRPAAHPAGRDGGRDGVCSPGRSACWSPTWPATPCTARPTRCTWRCCTARSTARTGPAVVSLNSMMASARRRARWGRAHRARRRHAASAPRWWSARWCWPSPPRSTCPAWKAGRSTRPRRRADRGPRSRPTTSPRSGHLARRSVRVDGAGEAEPAVEPRRRRRCRSSRRAPTTSYSASRPAGHSRPSGPRPGHDPAGRGATVMARRGSRRRRVCGPRRTRRAGRRRGCPTRRARVGRPVGWWTRERLVDSGAPRRRLRSASAPPVHRPRPAAGSTSSGSPIVPAGGADQRGPPATVRRARPARVARRCQVVRRCRVAAPRRRSTTAGEDPLDRVVRRARAADLRPARPAADRRRRLAGRCHQRAPSRRPSAASAASVSAARSGSPSAHGIAPRWSCDTQTVTSSSGDR